MGQYQQWLLHRSIDQRLRQELETLEAELEQLESQLDALFLEQCERELPPLAENPILNALMFYVMNHTESSPADERENGVYTETQEDQSSSEYPGEDSSLEPFSQGDLPDTELQEASHALPATPSMTHAEVELLPDEMLGFIDAYAQTDPQIELPRWLRKIAVASNTTDGTRPIDQESIRTNRLVQRWVERWGKQTPFGASPEHEGSPDA